MVVVTPMNGEKAPVPARPHMEDTDTADDDRDELAEDLRDIPVHTISDADESRTGQASLPKRPTGVPALNIAAAVQVQARSIESDEDCSESSSREGERDERDGTEQEMETQDLPAALEDTEESMPQTGDQTADKDVADEVTQDGLRHRAPKTSEAAAVEHPTNVPENAGLERTATVQKAAALVAQRRQPGFGRPSFTTMLIGFIGIYILFSFVQLYFVFLPKSCSGGAQQRCLTPLFPPGQKVDIFVFASKSPEFPSKGAAFWNASGVSLEEGVTARAIVPLPSGVRNNGSLYAHVSVVKAGSSPFPKDHLPAGQKRSRKPQVYPYEGLLTMSTSLTKHMARIHSNHSMLVSTSTSSPASATAAIAGGDANGSTSVESAPGTAQPGGVSEGDPQRRSDNVTAEAAASRRALDDKQIPQLVAVLLLAFALSGIFAPTLPLALLRYLNLAALAYLLHPLLAPHLPSAIPGLQPPPPSSSLATSSQAPAPAAGAAINASLKHVFYTEREVVAHWKPLLRLRYVSDAHEYPDHELPMSHIAWDARHRNMLPRHYQIYNQPHDKGQWKYVPVAFVDDFGMQAKHYIPLGSDKRLPDPAVTIQFESISLSRFQVLKFLEGSFEMMKESGLQERDLDDVKDLVSDRSLKVLGLTYLITFLHVTFDFLAFKNDIGFFRGRETYEGLSSRSLLSSFVCSLIIFLYLLDNDYTSRIVLASTGISTLIEGWKAKKVSKASIQWRFLLPWVVTRRGGPNGQAETAAEKRTEEIDAQGMKWLGRGLYPLVAAWAVYSLITRPHKSWWSWAIHSLAHAVYTFGFIGMTPQLFVNYKLKSVAHLPWKPFMYKAFNTFIDDVFSWVIAMPMSHRIACLRDDVVFFVYLYQRWLYPVDKTRPNEFGMAYELPEEAAAATASAEGGAKESKKDA